MRPAEGKWYVKPSSTGADVPPIAQGAATDVPVPADYDDDGAADFAVYRPSNGEWYTTSSRSLTGLPLFRWGGEPMDTPVPGDYSGLDTSHRIIARRAPGSPQVTWYAKGWGEPYAFGSFNETPLR